MLDRELLASAGDGQVGDNDCRKVFVAEHQLRQRPSESFALIEAGVTFTGVSADLAIQVIWNRHGRSGTGADSQNRGSNVARFGRRR